MGTAGILCLASWTAVDRVIDNRVKLAEGATRSELIAAKEEAVALSRLAEVFRALAESKQARLAAALTDMGAKTSLDRLRRALTPETHVVEVLQNLAVYLRKWRAQDCGPNVNVRVALYLGRSGVLRLHKDYDKTHLGGSSFRSYAERPEAFEIGRLENALLVVQCLGTNGVLVVPDCDAASSVGEFQFFHSSQTGYLKSVAAYDLGGACAPTGEVVKAALAIDANREDFFRHADRDELLSILVEFGTRIKLELLLDAVLNPKGATP